MASTRRLGAVQSETRALLIDAASRILTQRGAAAVTARNLAETVGLQRHIVHYYFGTIEDLFIAIMERDTRRTLEWLAEVLKTRDPIYAIWALGQKAATQTLEFSVLASRSAAIQERFKTASEGFRVQLTCALEQYFQAQGITTELPPVAITIALQSIAFTVAVEGLLDINGGHEALKKAADKLFAVLATPKRPV